MSERHEQLRKLVSIALHKHIEEKYISTRKHPEASYHVSMIEEAPVAFLAIVERPGEEENPIVLIQANTTTTDPANAEVSFNEIKVEWSVYEELGVKLRDAVSRTRTWIEEHTCGCGEEHDKDEERDDDDDEEEEADSKSDDAT